MYLNYYGLQEAPFSITPDPGFIYLSGRHRDALAHLLYGVGQSGSGGFVQLTGEVGTGKTTLCRALLEQVPAHTHIALILNPLMNPVEMLEAICEELGISIAGVEASSKGLVDRLNGFLLDAHARGERVVLVIDEAQNLSIESLEQVRLLTNLETSKEKLLQIILLGQPELRELLQRRSLRQLAQRITARYHLTPLGQEDTTRYVGHRLAVAGASRNPFSRSGLKALYQRSQGVPRLVNIIADRALAAGFAAETDRIDASLVNAAADEVQLGEPGVHSQRWRQLSGLAAAAVLILALGWIGGQWLADRGQNSGQGGVGTRELASETIDPEPAAQMPTTASTTASTTVSPSASGTTSGSSSPLAVPEDASASDAGSATGSEGAPATASAIPRLPGQDAPVGAVMPDPGAVGPAAEQANFGNAGDGSVIAPGPGAESERTLERDPGPEAQQSAELGPAWFEEQDLRAWQGLADRWGKGGDAALLQASCLGRDGLGFACIQDQGNWLRIRQLGLPVILILQGDETHHLLLNGMQGDQLLVGHGSARTTVPRDAIEAVWYGDYLVAWPQAADWPREIGVGDTGEPVERVVALAANAPEPFDGSAEFDDAFERWLVAFQDRNGLDADGIVGPKTLLYLMRHSVEEPRLVTALKGED